MKKIMVLAIIVVTLLSCNSLSFAEGLVGQDIGDVLVTDVVTYINGHPISTYDIYGFIAIRTDHLANYGFDVLWDSENRKITISRNVNKEINPMKDVNEVILQEDIGNKISDLIYTDIETYIGNRRVPCFNMDGYMAIYVEDVSFLGDAVWNSEQRTFSINLNNNTHNNGLNVEFVKDRVIVTDKKGNYDVNPVVTNVYYNTVEDKIRVGENTIYTESGENNLYLHQNEIYIGTVLKQIISYKTDYDAMFQANGVVLENVFYQSDLEYVKTKYKDYIIQANSIKEKLDAQQLAEELKANNNEPIKFTEVNVTYNSIGTPEATVAFKNLSQKNIDAFEFEVYCYDNYDRPVKHYLYKTNRYGCIYQSENQSEIIKPGEIFEGFYWTIYGHDNTTKITVKLISVHYTDGTTWER